jgi:dTDP-4-amino-4,6-dideoxygalactose transaminase
MESKTKLAIHGGDKIRTDPMVTSGPRFDDQELKELKEALDQQTLFYWYGEKVKTFRRQFATMYGVKHCHMVTSGTAALHVATASVGVGPGDEVITSPITDQGTIIAILAQGGVPVFADLDPHTYSVTEDD